ncbi:hypothetical protein Tco_0751367 [Tanacetum coccineum]|uniref:Uncharacterized protein n=1 Tax=Tanacetum coccineum TaxID=301880 RepID=A0ABQ4Z6G8_9ASTR
MVYKNEINKRYYFHLDYQRFEIGADLLRHDLKTSPRQPNQPFVKPPCQEELDTFIKKLDYVDSLIIISQVVVNKLHQPWRTFLSILNKCLTRKSSRVDRAKEPIVQILWGLVNSKNVDFAKLIWEDFSEEELVEKLKLVAKGEPKGKPTFRIPIPEAMMSREIKEFDAYLNYMAKYLNVQFGSLTLGRGQGKGYMRKGVLEMNAPKKKKAGVPRRSRTITILKLKAQKHVSPNAQLLLNFKRGAKESKGQRILEEFRKTLGEGSGAAPNSLNHSDSSDNSIWESIDDDKTESDKDFDHKDDNDDSNKDSDHGDGNDYSDINFDAKEDQTAGFGILEDYNKFLNEPHEVEMSDLLNEPMYTETQTLTIVPLLETGVGILINHTEVIKDSIKDNMPNFVPQAVSGYVHPRLERTDLDVIKKNPVNLFQSSFTPSVDTTEYELKHQLYEKMFETNAYLTHNKHRTLYVAFNKNQCKGEKNIKRRKGVGGSSSKKEKAPDDTSNYERFEDADEPRQEQEEVVPT